MFSSVLRLIMPLLLFTHLPFFLRVFPVSRGKPVGFPLSELQCALLNGALACFGSSSAGEKTCGQSPRDHHHSFWFVPPRWLSSKTRRTWRGRPGVLFHL